MILVIRNRRAGEGRCLPRPLCLWCARRRTFFTGDSPESTRTVRRDFTRKGFTMQEEHTHEGQEHAHTDHAHTHDPEVIRKISLRLAKAEGHLHSVRGMLDSGRDCSEVLLQLSAVRAAVDNAGKELLKEHISHCIVDAIRENDRHELDELNKAIDQFMK